MLSYISNSAHYKEVLSRVLHVKESLWIGTADIKDLYIEDGKTKKPFLEVLAKLIKKGVAVRLIHAKEPGPNFREDFDRFPILFDGLERVLCPRVHFKMMIFDGKDAYIGSANLTGALTDVPEIVAQAMDQFDEVWIGKHCKTCKRKDFCPDPILA